MSTPVLTPSEVKTLHFLATRDSTLRTPRGRRPSIPLVGSPEASALDITCGDFHPPSDDIEYHSDSVEDGIRTELDFTEISDATWIYNSHQIGLDVYEYQEEIANHWKYNQHKFLTYALERTYKTDSSSTRNFYNTRVSCRTMLDRVNNIYKYTVSNSEVAMYRTYGRFRANTTNRPGFSSLKYAGQASLSHGVQHLTRWSVRRQYMYQQNWGEMSNAAYHVTRQQPDGIFQLMNNAQSLYADIAAGAIQEQKVQKQSTLSKIGQVVGIAASVASFFS